MKNPRGEEELTQIELELLGRLPKTYSVFKPNYRYPSYVLITIKIQGSELMTKQSSYDQNMKEILLELWIMHSQFPEIPPKVKFKTNFGFPTLADGRDVLLDILKAEWNPTFTLYEIVRSIPRFINTYLSNKNNPFNIGIFYLDEEISQEDWNYPAKVGKYNCKECLKDSRLQDLVLHINQTTVLFYEPLPSVKKEAIFKLKLWKYLWEIKSIERFKDTPNRVIINWQGDSTQNKNKFSQELYFEKADPWMNLFFTQMKRIGISYESSTTNKLHIKETDVKKSRISEKDIKLIEMNIESLEKEQAKAGSSGSSGSSKSITESLSDLYSQAIEYYSASGDTQYVIYITKLKNIMTSSYSNPEPSKKEGKK